MSNPITITTHQEALDYLNNTQYPYFSCISVDVRDETICFLALNKCHDTLSTLWRVPKDIMTYDFCLKAVKEIRTLEYNFIQHINDEYKTLEICLEWLKNYSSIDFMQYLPKSIITKKTAKQFVELNAGCLQYIPNNLKTKELYYTAIISNKYPNNSLKDILKLIPDKIKDEEFYDFIISERPSLWYGLNMCIPDKFKTKELLLKHFVNCPEMEEDMTENMAEELLTEELCFEMVQKNPYNLRNVPYDLRSKRICDVCFAETKDCFRNIPDELKTFDMSIKAIICDKSNIENVHYETFWDEFEKMAEYYKTRKRPTMNDLTDIINSPEFSGDIKIKREEIRENIKQK